MSMMKKLVTGVAAVAMAFTVFAAGAPTAEAKKVKIRVQSVIPSKADEVTMLKDFAANVSALTNGDVLSALIKDGATALADEGGERQGLAKRVFMSALGRSPNQAESTMLAELSSGDNGAESVEDVLWAVTMLPEFQLIY